eukprot:TRINITY_DN12290_c0_g2_i2.p1 TRINITY_DN12290_c0_g2~~TRINITY_DN12290_c0_g2_i2.p1  ORF type:complete len:226 (-),score=36.58 TRINITY_DN12290_c0_g2_i2:162-839(-)
MSGNFIACSEKVGVMRVWAASQKTHKAVYRLSVTGVSCVKSFPIDPFLFLIGFRDGSLGVYSVDKRHMLWNAAAGHSETIFDLAFKPDHPNVLATAGYDGLVKIWNLDARTLHRTMQNRNEKRSSPLFSLSWAPEDGTKLATSNIFGKITIWNYDTGEIVCDLQPGSEKKVSKVAWSPLDKSLLACGSSDNKAFVINLENSKMKIIRTYAHNDVVNGVAWNPFNK